MPRPSIHSNGITGIDWGLDGDGNVRPPATVGSSPYLDTVPMFITELRAGVTVR